MRPNIMIVLLIAGHKTYDVYGFYNIPDDFYVYNNMLENNKLSVFELKQLSEYFKIEEFNDFYLFKFKNNEFWNEFIKIVNM